MADAITPQLGLTNPEVGGSQNTWGGKLNENFSLLDSFVASRVLRSGDTMSGALGIVPGTPTAPGLFFSGDSNTGIYQPAANQWAISIDGTPRFSLSATTTEIANNVSVTGTTSLQSLSATTINATGNAVISTSSSTPALRITQTGTGEALRVEDEANPDTTPFVIDAAGNVGVGTSAPVSKLDVAEIATIKRVISGNTMDLNFYNGSGAGVTGNVARIRCDGDGISNDFGALSFWTGRINSAAISERMRLDSAGNLGLGVTPSAWSQGKAFEVGGLGNAVWGNGSGDSWLLSNAYFNAGFKYASTGIPSAALRVGAATGVFELYTAASGTAGGSITAFSTPKVTLTQGGNLLVGTTTDSGARVRIDYSGQTFGARIGTTATNGTAIQFVYEPNTQVGTITTTTTSTAYNTSSDYRLKDNQQPLTNSGEFIDALKPKTWTWTADGSKGVGFIAHEVQAISPGSVTGEKDAVDAEGNPVYQAMEYGSAEFIANIVAELQSLRKRLAALESK